MKDGTDLNKGPGESDDVQSHNTDERSNFWDHKQIPPNINFSVCPPNSSSQISQNHTLAFGYNQFYPNMSYINQPLQPSPPYYQQPFQPSQPCYQQPLRPPPYRAEQTLGGIHVSHHNTKVSTGSSERPSKRKWTKEEDLQLTIAYVRVSTDPAVGVGQTRLRLWERVRMMFITLMREKHGQTTESNARTHGACENRMNEIKTQCTKWIASRERALATTESGWSAYDIEKHCHSLYEEDGSGSFKCEECWDVLKQCPNWQESKPKNPIKAKRPFPETI